VAPGAFSFIDFCASGEHRVIDLYVPRNARRSCRDRLAWRLAKQMAAVASSPPGEERTQKNHGAHQA
jgi:hypothetical protein